MSNGLCFLFFVTLLQHIHRLITLVETVYPIANVFEVINKKSQRNLVKTFLVPYGEVLTGSKHKFIALNGKISALDT